MIKNVFLDFNGTIIDDVQLCVDLLNKLLKGQNKPTVDIKRYKDIFGFPIIDYYKAAGLDFNIEPFNSMAIKFIDDYQPMSMKCDLYPHTYEALEELNKKGVNVYILSASEKNNLKEQCDNFGITKYFKAILGIDNIHAASKVQIAIDYINANNINRNESVFIGDTLHDYEVAQAVGIDCRLVSCGHQPVEKLKTAGVPVLEYFADILKEI